MSSSEELSQYEEKSTSKKFKSLNNSTRDNNPGVYIPVIPRDMYGLFGVHVSNLPAGISERVLVKAFSSVGPIAVCKILEPKPRRGSQNEILHSITYAFVKFTSYEEAHAALTKFNGFKLNGRTLSVRPAYVSEKTKRNPSPNVRHHHGDTSSEEGSGNSNVKEREEPQRTNYVMGSSDCRLKDGRLHDSDIMLFNGTSSKIPPPKKANGGRVLAPQFRKDYSPMSLESNASHDSHTCQGVPPTSKSEVHSVTTDPRHKQTIHQQTTVSGAQTSPDHCHNNTDDSITASSSAFKPYQGASITSNQEAGIPKHGSMEDGMASVAADLSHLGLSTQNRSVMENKNASTWNHSQGNDAPSWRQGGAQGVTSWSQTGGAGVTTWSNSRDKPMTSPDRNKSVPEWGPQTRSSVTTWSTVDVVQFFLNSDCAEYAGFFQEQEIDGRALMLLNRDTLLHFMKVGPALKVLQLIDGLRACGSPPGTGLNGW